MKYIIIQLKIQIINIEITNFTSSITIVSTIINPARVVIIAWSRANKNEVILLTTPSDNGVLGIQSFDRAVSK